MFVTKEEIRQARRVNLVDYLMTRYPNDFKLVGNSICKRDNPSLYVKTGVPGYHDFSTGEHGNSIDFLIRHYGHSFQGAVMELCRFHGIFSSSSVLPSERSSRFSLPPMAVQPFTSVITYLTSRSIPENVVMSLIQGKLLYQDTLHCNAVFVSREQDYCEIRGTGNVPFHGSRKLKPDRFWYLPPKVSPRIAFLCEAAIDAVSLMLIHKATQELYPDAVYISIGGVANQQTIERIKRRIPAVLAVDNDPAGEVCRQNNPDLLHLIPTGKDWNVDLCAYYAS